MKGEAGTIDIEVIGAQHSSPATIIEGETYTVRLTITNQSITAGIPVEATLRIGIGATVLSEVLIPTQEREEYFSANQTRTFDYTMYVPSGLGGYSGSISAAVMDPTGLIILDQATEPLVVEAALPPPPDFDLSVVIVPLVEPICPGASINIEATIHNKTAYEQPYSITYYVNEEVVAAEPYNLIAPNATYRGIFTYTVPTIGSYDIRVVVNGFEATTSFEAVEIPVGEPDMSIPINIITMDITVGANSYCSTLVTNRGTGEGDISCDWYLDDVFIETDYAHLVPGAHSVFRLITPVLIAGTHIVRAEFTWDGYRETRTGSFTAEAVPVEGPGTVWGYVYDRYIGSGVPIPGATLSISGIGTIPLNSQGYYEITLDARVWNFTCEASGYRTMHWGIEVRADERIKRSFAMTPL